MHEPQMPNLPMLRKVLDYIDEHPEEWKQNVWARQTPCGTSFCIAGHVAVIAGAEIAWESRKIGDEKSASYVRINGKAKSIELFALEELNLPPSQRDCFLHPIFDGTNSRERIQEIAEEIAASAGEKL